jgi:hypothetical protein
MVHYNGSGMALPVYHLFRRVGSALLSIGENKIGQVWGSGNDLPDVQRRQVFKMGILEGTCLQGYGSIYKTVFIFVLQ